MLNLFNQTFFADICQLLVARFRCRLSHGLLSEKLDFLA